MRVYHYDPATGIYYGSSSEADESPLEPGVFLIPAHATVIPPPEAAEGEQTVFAGEWRVETIPRLPGLTNENITSAPTGLFGGPTIAEVFGL